MADSTALLKRRGGQTLPGVRIPPSPFFLQALAITWRGLLLCDLAISIRFLPVLKTVLLRFGTRRGVALGTARCRAGSCKAADVTLRHVVTDMRV